MWGGLRATGGLVDHEPIHIPVTAIAKGFSACKDVVQAATRQKTGFRILVKPALPSPHTSFTLHKFFWKARTKNR